MKEKELDLDELHQAVSQMMDSGGKQKSKRESADATKVSPRPSVKVSERPVDARVDPVTPSDDRSTDRGETIAVRRPSAMRIMPKKRGMAMDVVQAAKPTAATPPSTRPSRTGAALQPTGPVVVSEPAQTESAAPTELASMSRPSSGDVSEDTLASLDMQNDGFARPKTVVEEPPQPHPALKSTFPDPLDVHGFNDKSKTDSPAETAIEMSEPEPKSTWDPLLDDMPETQTETPAEPEPEIAAPELSASPFLNAKVEKRPLGAFASHIPVTPQPEAEVAPEIAPSEPAPAEPATHDTDWQLPAEHPKADATSESVAPESATDTHAALAPLDHLRGTSIPPQYHAAEKESAKDDRPIFDTKNYHTPIEAHATPRRSGGSHAGIILTIILIILLIAAGVAAYFVATGGIDLQKLF